MKKVGIITLSGNENYGNRLQNYALQETVNKFNLEAETIWINNEPKKTIKSIIKKVYYQIFYGSKVKLVKNISKFTKKYIQNSKYAIYPNKSLNRLNLLYDYFIVGSDQVWNYTSGIMKDYFFLSFADYDKNTAYAPSFSVDTIEESWKPTYKEWLKNIKNISVREKKGQEIIKEICDQNVPVVLDPTMLLTQDEWRKLEINPKLNSKKYILTYFLGGKSPEVKKEIDEVANKYDLQIIDLMDFTKKKYLVGVNEFLYLFDNAEIIFTDSFHACVFSIIYNKPFYVFDRIYDGKNMNSRLDTLLETFKQKQRKVTTIKNIKSLFETNYEEVNQILEHERVKSLDFLKKSLELE